MARSKRDEIPPMAEEYAPEVREPGGYRQSDAAIERAISRHLADAGLEGIAVVVKDGEATISGSVERCADMLKAGQQACLVEGVRLVHDGLTATEPPTAAVVDGPTGTAPKMGKPGYER